MLGTAVLARLVRQLKEHCGALPALGKSWYLTPCSSPGHQVDAGGLCQ